MVSKQSRGFTLIEVLIAFAILALVLSAVFRTLSFGLSHERTAKLATARVLEARSILDRVGTELPLDTGSTNGQLATGEDWTLTIRLVEPGASIEAENIQLDAYLADLQVGGRDGRTLHLQTLKLGP